MGKLFEMNSKGATHRRIANYKAGIYDYYMVDEITGCMVVWNNKTKDWVKSVFPNGYGLIRKCRG